MSATWTTSARSSPRWADACVRATRRWDRAIPQRRCSISVRARAPRRAGVEVVGVSRVCRSRLECSVTEACGYVSPHSNFHPCKHHWHLDASFICLKRHPYIYCVDDYGAIANLCTVVPVLVKTLLYFRATVACFSTPQVPACSFRLALSSGRSGGLQEE
jgi:hypothetical protein